MKKNLLLSLALGAVTGFAPLAVVAAGSMAPAAAATAAAMPLGSVKTMDDALAAIKKKDVAKAFEKVKSGEVGINTCFYGVYTPLSYAASIGNRDLVAFFLSQGADVNGVDAQKSNSVGSVTMAVSANKPELVKELVKAGANVNLLAGYEPPFVRAAMAQNIPMMKLLIELGADPKGVDKEGRTALMMGMRRNGITLGGEDFLGVADYLIDTCGLDPNAKDDKGQTAIMHACIFLSPEQLMKFIAKGADPTVKTPKEEGLVAFIVKSGTPKEALEQLKLLEKYNLDFNNGSNVKAPTPLYSVVCTNMKCKDSLPLVQYMVEHGARTDIGWGAAGYPLLYGAAGNNVADSADLLQFLLDRKVGDVNELSKQGITALMNVKKPCMVEPLLKAGADPAIKDKQGKTAYMRARDAKMKAAFEAAGVKE